MTATPSLDVVWSRIERHAGETFLTKTGKSFRYAVRGSVVRPDCTNQNLSKSEFAKALAAWPLDGPGRTSRLVRGSAYIWAILHDSRILGTQAVGDGEPTTLAAATAPTPARPPRPSPPLGKVTFERSPTPTLRLKSAHSAFAPVLVPVPLEFEGVLRRDVFGAKNDKTLRQTLEHPRCSKLRMEVAGRYGQELDTPLGQFLMKLKASGDSFYRRFLNPYGDLEFCTFRIADRRFLELRGIYAYTVGVQLMYIGRCRDTMRKRVNQGYGSIHPENCFLYGQRTNCHLNAEIAKVMDAVSLWMYPMDSVADIEREERHLLRTYCPPWNLRLA